MSAELPMLCRAEQELQDPQGPRWVGSVSVMSKLGWYGTFGEAFLNQYNVVQLLTRKGAGEAHL